MGRIETNAITGGRELVDVEGGGVLREGDRLTEWPERCELFIADGERQTRRNEVCMSCFFFFFAK